MIDLHTHSIFSDGELIPSELVRRAKVMGYRALAITDHGDHSNVDFIIPRIVKVCQKIAGVSGMMVIPGIELTHVPPALISELAREVRLMGAGIVVVHGETIVEPVIPGTNLAALQSPIDILAHPGLITEEEASIASRKAIFLEISTRRGHSLTNGHVLKMARQFNAPLVLNTDSHAPQDLVPLETAWKIALGAGMTKGEVEAMFKNSEGLVKRALG
ncbi:MAG: histidinol phosphate phosphatase domain-containing protein [Syntrophales bacterium]|nr:histidinol phosphate phosphatase domain-containing protein [Syntrophales bacterium]